MTIADHYQALCHQLQSIAASPEVEARWLLEELCDCPFYAIDKQATLTQPQASHLETMLARRFTHEPLQYIVGYGYFYGLRLELSPAVLIPRPETELMVEQVLKHLRARLEPHPCLLDLGTGSGAIACAIKHEHPAAQVWASDISPEALALAQRNASQLGLPITFRQSDVLSQLSDLTPHVIVANLPYLPEADRTQAGLELNYEPSGALFAGTDGLACYRRLLAQLPTQTSSPTVFLELDPRNIRQAAQLAHMCGLQTHITPDLVGRERILRLG